MQEHVCKQDVYTLLQLLWQSY